MKVNGETYYLWQAIDDEGAISKLRDMKTLQKFASVHASVHNHFNLELHLTTPETFKQNRSAALAECRHLTA